MGAGRYFLKDLQPVEKKTRSRLILKDCSSWEGPTLEQGESVRRKEQQNRNMDCPQPSIPHPTCTASEGKAED